ncbi:MAG: DUF927 domain-containing protein [Roseococcus sp.]|nr:DUF927 domain-containing protein [Roseococcus sp.]
MRSAIEDAAPAGEVEQGGEVVGFEMHADGLYRKPPDRERFRVCGPFRVAGETRVEDGATGWGLRLEWWNRDRQLVSATVSRGMLAGDGTDARRRLADGGLHVGGSDAARAALRQYLSDVTSRRRFYAWPRTGWYDDAPSGAAFLYPGEVFGTVPNRALFLDMDRPPEVYRQAGTLDGWRAGVARAAAGNSRMVLAICVAFMGPLLRQCGEEGGCFHLRGSSSRGKTTAAKLAASVYGSPVGLRPFIRKWRATDNAIETLAAEHSDCALVMDEIGQADPKTVGEVAYMLADGQGKARARAGGGNRGATTWRVVVLSTGEESLAAYMQHAGKGVKTGQEVRFLDIPIEAGGAAAGGFETAENGAEAGALAQRLERAAVEHHGTAGPAFLAWFVPRVAADPVWMGERWRSWLAAWNAAELPRGADGQVARAGRRFALAALAGELATEAGITGWEPGQARWAAGECFRAWMAQFGGTGGREAAQIIAATRRFILEHGQARFETIKDAVKPAGDLSEGEPDLPEGKTIMKRAGWRWQEQEAGDGPKRWVHGIAPDVFAAEICQPLGAEPREARAVLAKAGVIRTRMEGGKQRFTIRRSVPGMGARVEMIAVEAGIFEGEG